MRSRSAAPSIPDHRQRHDRLALQYSDSALDFLGANDVVTLTYTVQVDDGNGGSAAQDVTITVQGTEDAPTITSGADGDGHRDADLAPGENTASDIASGAVTFTDVDLSDIETARSPTRWSVASLANGYVLTPAEQTALVNAFTIGRAAITTAATARSAGTTISDSALDFLGANDVVTLTYTVQVDDGNGGISRQDVTITVQGTNDAPAITSAAQAGTVTEIGGPGAGREHRQRHRHGAVTFTDVDLSDIEHSSFANTLVNATLANGYVLTPAEQTALVNAFSIGSASHNWSPATARSTGPIQSPTARSTSSAPATL